MAFSLKTFLVLFGLVCLTPIIFGLNNEASKEKRCLDTLPKVAKKIDLKWATAVDPWYWTHGSLMDLYRTAEPLAGTPVSELKEDDLYYNGCITMKWGSGTKASLFGFNGKKMEVSINPVTSNGVFKFELPDKSHGDLVITLTDNKSFLFLYQCWGDNEASWVALSTGPTLTEKAQKKIFKHAKSLGFDEKYFTKMRFETCQDERGGSSEEGKDEL